MAALVRLYLTVLGVPISRVATNCQERASVVPTLAHPDGRCKASTRNSPWLLCRTHTSCQAVRRLLSYPVIHARRAGLLVRWLFGSLFDGVGGLVEEDPLVR